MQQVLVKAPWVILFLAVIQDQEVAHSTSVVAQTPAQIKQLLDQDHG